MNLIESHIERLPHISRKKCEKIAVYGGVVFALISLASHSSRRGMMAAGAYAAALAVQYAVAPFFERFERNDGNLGVMAQSIKDLIAEVTVLSCMKGLKAVRTESLAFLWVFNAATGYFADAVAPSDCLPVEGVAFFTSVVALFWLR